MSAEGAAVDVAVVAYNSRDVITACVERAMRLPGVGRVVVVDHGPDGSGDVARAAGATVIENPANPGFGAGQNAAVRAGAAPYVLLLNPDADPGPDGLAAARRLLDEQPDVAAVQGVIVNRVTGLPERSQGVAVGPVHLVGRALGAARLLRWAPVATLARRSATLSDHVDRVPVAPVEVETLAATAVVVRRRAFDAVGGFDEGFFLYGEDIDLCRRLRAAGWRIVAIPEVSALHDSGGSAPSTWSRERTWWEGTMRMAARWWSPGAWSVGVAAAVLQWIKLTVRDPRRAGQAWRSLVGGPLAARRSLRQELAR